MMPYIPRLFTALLIAVSHAADVTRYQVVPYGELFTSLTALSHFAGKSTPLTCAVRCTSTTDCVGITYDDSSRLCTLVGNDSVVGSYTYTPEMSLYVREGTYPGRWLDSVNYVMVKCMPGCDLAMSVAKCASYGAVVAPIRSERINTFLHAWLGEMGNTVGARVGGARVSGVWKFHDGSNVGYTNWTTEYRAPSPQCTHVYTAGHKCFWPLNTVAMYKTQTAKCTNHGGRMIRFADRAAWDYYHASYKNESWTDPKCMGLYYNRNLKTFSHPDGSPVTWFLNYPNPSPGTWAVKFHMDPTREWTHQSMKTGNCLADCEYLTRVQEPDGDGSGMIMKSTGSWYDVPDEAVYGDIVCAWE